MNEKNSMNCIPLYILAPFYSSAVVEVGGFGTVDCSGGETEGLSLGE
jgi:hypothetical protein